MRNIQVISINHQTHNSEDRISLNLNDEGWERLFVFMSFNLNVNGYVHLRTCNRIEIYYESDIDLRDRIIGKWLSLLELNAELQKDSFQSYFGYQDSIEHLLHLSAGFKSAIYGDDQILSQLKKAFESARRNDSMSTLLERAYQSIMRFHKQICRDTDYKSQTVSLAYQALKSAKYRFGTESLKNKNVLIIGAGDMASQVVKYLSKFRFGSVAITNRTISKAMRLAASSSLGVVPYDSLDFQKYELVISCIDQGYALIDKWTSVKYYIDLSLHSSTLSDIPVSHVLLNDLQEIINERNAERLNSVGKVQQILSEKVKEYVDWCDQWHARSMALG